MDELKTNIKAAVTSITVTTLRKVSAKMDKKVRACIRKHRRHFEHLPSAVTTEFFSKF
jgi:arsenate reductase-like glutaredoxin family protein